MHNSKEAGVQKTKIHLFGSIHVADTLAKLALQAQL